MTNRKSHTHFRFVPKSTALDDLERPLRTLFKMHAFSEPITKIWMKTDLHYHRRKYCAMTMTMRFLAIQGLCGYSLGFLGEGASSDSGGLSKTAIISTFAGYFFRALEL